MISTISQIMTENPLIVSVDDCVRKAMELMEEYCIGCLPVLDSSALVGIITSRDIKRSHPNRLVADAMSQNVITVSPETSIWDAQQLMNRHRIERLIVVKDRYPVGVVVKAQLLTEIGKYVDPLTNLNQAPYLRYKALDLLRGGKEISIIFLDLDNFGKTNKKYGHVVADEILRHLARNLKLTVVADKDYLCRYAGDEFAIVTTRSLTSAKDFAATFFEVLNLDDWPHGIEVHFSIGIAGGRRNRCRLDDNLTEMVDNLINLASLSSSRAKHLDSHLVVVDFSSYSA